MSEEKSKKESLGVVLRFRPLNSEEKAYKAKHEAGDQFCDAPYLHIDSQAKSIRDERRNRTYSRFDEVLDMDTNQATAFDSSSKSLVQDVCNGFNAGLFAYGQSGSGKSYTLIGKEGQENYNNKEHWGLIPRTVEEFFNEKERMEKSDNPFEGIKRIRIAFFEIYQEEIYDLLDTDPNKYLLGFASPLCKTAGREKRHLDSGLVKFEVDNAQDAVKLLHIGTERRRKASMPLNPVSSRSHAIYQVIIDKNNADNTKGVASLYFADLMGSEKMVEGFADRADEAPNDELLSLGRVIQSLAEASKGNSKAVATYREHTLTYVLQDVLGGNSKTMVIVTGVLSPLQYKPTQGALEFGDNCKGVQRVVQVEKKQLSHAEMVARMQYYENQIKGLNFQVSQKDIEINDLKSGIYTEPAPGSAATPGQPYSGGGGACATDGTCVAGSTGMTEEDVWEMIKMHEDKLAKRQEYFNKILQAATIQEQRLNDELQSEKSQRAAADAALKDMEAKSDDMKREWVSLLEPGADGANSNLESSDVIRKFASVLEENEQLKQQKRDLKEEQEKVRGHLRQAESVSRETQLKFNDTREKNTAQQKELHQNDTRVQELMKDLETQRKELLGVNTENKKLNSHIDHLNQSEFALTQSRDELRQKLIDKDVTLENAFEDAAKAEREKRNVMELLQSLSEAVNPKKLTENGVFDETDAKQSAADLAEVAEACRTAVEQNQSEAQSAQANLNKTVIAQQWMHAKDKGIIKKREEEFQDQLRIAEEVLQNAHNEHKVEAARLRKEITDCSQRKNNADKQLAVQKSKVRQLENKLAEATARQDQVEQAHLGDQEASKAILRSTQTQLNEQQQKYTALSTKEKQLELNYNTKQHQLLVMEAVLSDHVTPQLLKAITAAVMDRMANDSSGDLTAMKGGGGGEDKQGPVQRMYSEALQLKAEADERADRANDEVRAKDHELTQAILKKKELDMRIAYAEKENTQLKVQKEMEDSRYDDKVRVLNQETASLKSKSQKMETTLNGQIAELRATLAREKEEYKHVLAEEQKATKLSEYRKKAVDVQLQELQDRMHELEDSMSKELEDVKSELDTKVKEVNQSESQLSKFKDSKISSAVKEVIKRQRAEKSASLEKIKRMHDTRQTSTPQAEDTSVEEMYRDLLQENIDNTKRIDKLTVNLRKAQQMQASPMRQPEPVRDVHSGMRASPMSSREASAISAQLLESRRLMVESYEGISPSPIARAVASPAAFSGFEAYRQDLLNRAKKSLSSSKCETPMVPNGGLFDEQIADEPIVDVEF